MIVILLLRDKILRIIKFKLNKNTFYSIKINYLSSFIKVIYAYLSTKDSNPNSIFVKLINVNRFSCIIYTYH